MLNVISSFSFAQNLTEFNELIKFDTLRQKRENLNTEIPLLEQKIKELKASFIPLEQLKERQVSYENYLSSTIRALNKLRNKKQLSNFDREDIEFYVGDSISYSEAITKIKTELTKANTIEQQIKGLEDSVANKKSILHQTEQEINIVLMPEFSRRKFMQLIALYFAVLILVLMIGFFWMTKLDEGVRKAIFGSDSGIQFITLFAIIISIILFGITGILEGKELAALIGAIAGYILGKSSK